MNVSGVVAATANKRRTPGQRAVSEDRSQVTAFTLIVPDTHQQAGNTFSQAIQTLASTSNREFRQNWEMTNVCRVRAGILPGPIAGLARMDDVQVTQLHGASENPDRASKRSGHSKADQMVELLTRINNDLGKIPDCLAFTVDSGSGEVTQVTSPGGLGLPTREIVLRLHQMMTQDPNRDLDYPFNWLFNHFSQTFATKFLTSLLNDPNLLLALTQIATHAKLGAPWTAIQGFPGSGKTHIMVVIAILLIVELEVTILWTTQGNKALESAALLIQKLSGPREMKHVVRLPSAMAPSVAHIDVPFEERSATLSRRKDNIRLVLITTGSLVQELNRTWSALRGLGQVHFLIQDEAQQFGSPEVGAAPLSKNKILTKLQLLGAVVL